MKKLCNLYAVFFAFALAMFSGFASAAGTAITVTDVTDTITAQVAPVGLIGAAVLGLIVVVKAWKWVRRAM